MTDYKEEIPDVIGLTEKEGCRILQKSGCRVYVKHILAPGSSNIGTRIVRQRLRERGTVDLLICSEYYIDPASADTDREE